MAYQLQIFKKNWTTQQRTDGRRARTLTHATDISVRQDLNAPLQITFRVPRGSDDAGVLELGEIVRVLEDSKIIASGVIVGPLDKTRPMIPVTVAGKEEILNWSITPYEFELEGNTAEAQVRELLKNYRFFRQNTPDEFNAGTLTNTEVLTVAADPDEYFVTLNETNEVYAESGTYLSQPILCTDDRLGAPSDITRLRYLAELGNETAITVAFRYSNAAATRTPRNRDWSAWSSEYPLTTENTEKLGLTEYSISANFRWIQARFSLSTSDTSITPALQAFEIVCEYPCEITPGNINLPGPKLYKAFSFTSHHQAIREIVASRNAEMRVTDDYQLDIAPRFGETTATQTFEVGKNCNVVKFQQNDRRLSTEIWGLGKGKGIAQELVDVDASRGAIARYGERPWVYRYNATTKAEQKKEITDELARRDQPTLNATLDEIGSPLSVQIGDTVNFLYTRRNINTTLRVIGIRAADPRKGQPRQFELISHEGFFFSEPEPETQEVGKTGADGKDGRDAPVSWGDVGIENICYQDETGIGAILPVTATVTANTPNVSYKCYVRDAADNDIVQLSLFNSIFLGWTSVRASQLPRDFSPTWDGRDSDGHFVETGTYKFVLVKWPFGSQTPITVEQEVPVTLRRQVIPDTEIPRSYKFDGTTVELFELTAAEIQRLKILEPGDTIGFFDDATEHARATIASATLPECEDIQPDTNTAQLSVAWILPPKVPFGEACSIRTTRILQINTEEIFAVSEDESIPDTQLPDNQWGYDDGGTQDGLTWQTKTQSVSKEKPYLFVSTREFLSLPIKGEETCDKWSTPALIERYPQDAVGSEEIFAVSTDEVIPDTQLPDNQWGYDDGGTRGTLTWHTTMQSVSKEKPYLFVSTRDILGTPAKGDDVDDEWSTPALIARYGGGPVSTKEPIKGDGTEEDPIASPQITTNSKNISTNASKIASNATAISTNASKIAANSTAISTNVAKIAENTTAIAENSTAISTNASIAASRYLTNVKAISTVNARVTTLSTQVETNSKNIATNASKIAENSTAISTNASVNTVQSKNISTNASVNAAQSTAISTNVVEIAKRLITVATDDTITGDGTAKKPLGAVQHEHEEIDTISEVASKNASKIAENSTAISTNASVNSAQSTKIDENSTAISTNASVNTAQSTAISTNVAKIAENSTTISTNASIAASRYLTNVKAISTVNSRVTTLSKQVETNSKNISTNASVNTAQSTAISTNASQIAENSTTISTNLSWYNFVLGQTRSLSSKFKGVSTNASTAIKNASTALSTATANTTAITTVSKNASTALSTAKVVSTAVDTASKAASTASNKASTALSTANANATTLETASTNASTALSTANIAKTTAGTWKNGTFTRVTNALNANESIVYFAGSVTVPPQRTSFAIEKPTGGDDEQVKNVFGVVTAIPQRAYEGITIPTGYIDGSFTAQFGITGSNTLLYFVGQYTLTQGSSRAQAGEALGSQKEDSSKAQTGAASKATLNNHEVSDVSEDRIVPISKPSVSKTEARHYSGNIEDKDIVVRRKALGDVLMLLPAVEHFCQSKGRKIIFESDEWMLPFLNRLDFVSIALPYASLPEAENRIVCEMETHMDFEIEQEDRRPRYILFAERLFNFFDMDFKVSDLKFRDWFSLSDEERKSENILRKNGWDSEKPSVLLAPKTKSELRHWGKEYSLASRLSELDIQSVFVHSEPIDVPNIKNSINLTGKIDVLGLASVASYMDIAVLPNSGPMHVCGVLGIPTIVCEGNVLPGENYSGQYPTHHRIETQCPLTDVVSGTCFDGSLKTCNFTEEYRACQLEITVDSVYRKSLEFLSENEILPVTYRELEGNVEGQNP